MENNKIIIIYGDPAFCIFALPYKDFRDKEDAVNYFKNHIDFIKEYQFLDYLSFTIESIEETYIRCVLDKEYSPFDYIWYTYNIYKPTNKKGRGAKKVYLFKIKLIQ